MVNSNKLLMDYMKDKENSRRGREGGKRWSRSHPEEHRCADALCRVSFLAIDLEGGRPKNTNTSPKRIMIYIQK
jgi:hypothetical protein